MAVGDVNSDQKGSGARYNDGKVQYHYTPLHLLDGVNRVWTIGAKKYKEWNWTKGMAWTHPYNSMQRHMSAWFRGEDRDPETGESHLDHAICNLLMLKHYETHYVEGDDRPKMIFNEKPRSLPDFVRADPVTRERIGNEIIARLVPLNRGHAPVQQTLPFFGDN
jgi:hypothetical protein